MRVLMITSEWPTPAAPHAVPFIVQRVNALRRAGAQVEVFPFRGGQNPFRYLAAWQQVRRRLARSHFDLIHAQWGQSGLLALFSPLPLVITFRGSDLEGFPNEQGREHLASRVLKHVSKLMARRADNIILVADRLARHIGDRPYHVIPSGLNLDLFRPQPQTSARRALNLPVDKGLVLFAADPANPIKRHALAEAAVRGLPDNLNTELLVVNGQPHDRMPLYMNACDALLLTSTHEGSPNVVKEALACNLPIVAVDVGDVRERLAGVRGCVVTPDDTIQTLTAALETVLREDGRIAGRESVTHLDENRLARQIMQIYEQTLRAHHAAVQS